LDSWIDPWRNATVAIGMLHHPKGKQKGRKASGKPIFVVTGTGIIFGLNDDPTSTPWLVTAKHVFLDPSEEWEPETLQVRFPWFDERPVGEYLGIRVELMKNGKKRWLSHPDEHVDLACLPLTVTKEDTGRNNVHRVGLGDLATEDEIYEGAPVVVLGYPGAVGPSFWTRAIVRQGIVSWVSPSQPESSVFLIDSNIFPGNSGGPVFRIPAGPDRRGHFMAGGKVTFLGIVSQARVQMLPLTAGGKELEVQLKGKKKPESLFVPSFIGIGIIEPALHVRELLSTAAESITRRR
jgi:hypothetical protein